MSIKITGIGQTAFGELWEKSVTDLFREAVDAALKDAQVDPKDIDHVFVGSMLAGETSRQSQFGSLFATLYGTNTSGTRVEGACASGGLAVYQAIQTLQSQNASTVLVVGIEKMTDFSADEMAHLLMQAASEEERLSGATFPSLYALMAQAHMQKFGTTSAQMALASVLAHRNASQNPLAQFRKAITVEDILKSAPVAEPLKLLDCSPVSDGAVALVLRNEEPLPTKREAFLIQQACSTDTLSLAERSSLTELKATKVASDKIFRQAGIRREEIDLLEVHDCFSISALLALEDIGFSDKGKGGETIEKILNGDTSLPALNVSGGLKACGHPVGATGVNQIAEIALQLQGRAGKRQLKNPRYGLTQNVGGTGGTCVMHLLSLKPGVGSEKH